METPVIQPRVPAILKRAVLRVGIRPSRVILTIYIVAQRMLLFEKARGGARTARFPQYAFRRRFVISTSRHGAGQVMQSNRTPLGLHRVARKVGAGQPIGTVFKSRQPAGLTWQGKPDGGIVHRILWLEGLEPGFNRGGNLDTFQRYVYIHGLGNETTLGRPQSSGCIHIAGADLLPLFDRVREGTLVWIGER